MPLTLQPILVATAADSEGCLVFADDRLVAVLVRLSELHAEEAGFWFLEAGFGRLDLPLHPTFADLQAAQAWILERLADGGPAPAAAEPGPHT